MSLLEDLKSMVGGKPRFPHVERELAKTYGLTAEALKDARTSRQLARGQHWDLVKGLVCYNDAGKAALEADLGIATEKNPPEPAPAPAPAAAPLPDSPPNKPAPAALRPPGPSKKYVAPKPGEVRTLVAVAKVRNKRILRARDQDRVAWVRVKDSKNFRGGMELQASFIAGEQWQLVGRCPRWNGKF